MLLGTKQQPYPAAWHTSLLNLSRAAVKNFYHCSAKCTSRFICHFWKLTSKKKKECPKWINGDFAGKCSAPLKIRPLCWAPSICELWFPLKYSVTEFAGRGAFVTFVQTLCLVAHETIQVSRPARLLPFMDVTITNSIKKVKGGSCAWLLWL